MIIISSSSSNDVGKKVGKRGEKRENLSNSKNRDFGKIGNCGFLNFSETMKKNDDYYYHYYD